MRFCSSPIVITVLLSTFNGQAGVRNTWRGQNIVFSWLYPFRADYFDIRICRPVACLRIIKEYSEGTSEYIHSLVYNEQLPIDEYSARIIVHNQSLANEKTAANISFNVGKLFIVTRLVISRLGQESFCFSVNLTTNIHSERSHRFLMKIFEYNMFEKH